MSDTFSEREKSFEAKQKMDDEMQFKAVSRRNKLLGEWAAEKMGMSGSEVEAYAKTVVIADLEEPGDDDVVRKVMGDFESRSVSVSEDELRTEMERLLGIAVEQVKDDFEPLGEDHS
ncbi:DUF1476 domain-containing protein [Magnetovibrio sp. PR-2]|uniref:DUF1476 domain-containing protein n=1 Tax=Magnetovibrio sp. PR-2 TaxID=3120356 RepID=UPI002FCE5AFC